MEKRSYLLDLFRLRDEVALDNSGALKAAMLDDAGAQSMLGKCLVVAFIHVITVAVLVVVAAHKLSFSRFDDNAFH